MRSSQRTRGEETVEPSYRQLIVGYLRSVVEWRQRRAIEEPHEPRHRHSALLLEQLADFVETLPGDDTRIAVIGRATRTGEAMVPGPILANAVARFGFFTTEASLDGLLTRMEELALEDLGQAGRDPLRDLPF